MGRLLWDYRAAGRFRKGTASVGILYSAFCTLHYPLTMVPIGSPAMARSIARSRL
jgi:hypothetical protein